MAYRALFVIFQPKLPWVVLVGKCDVVMTQRGRPYTHTYVLKEHSNP